MAVTTTQNAAPKGLRKYLSVGSVINGTFGVVGGIDVYKERRRENPDEWRATSAMYGAADAALWTFLPTVAWAREMYNIAEAAGQSGMFDHKLLEQKNRAMYSPFASWKYEDTEQNYTMRQRATQVMAQSRQNVRSALGNEARSLHRGAY